MRFGLLSELEKGDLVSGLSAMAACGGGFQEPAQTLIKYGAHTDVQNQWGNSAMLCEERMVASFFRSSMEGGRIGGIV